MGLCTVLIDNYDSYTYNLYQHLAELSSHVLVLRNDAFRSFDELVDLVAKEECPDGRPCTIDNIVISPGPGRPDNFADFGGCASILLEAGDMPVLGICLGHQGLCHVFGAEIVHAPGGVAHGVLSRVQHDNSALFRDIPQDFTVVRYHSLAVNPSTMPSFLGINAWCDAVESDGQAPERGSDACSSVFGRESQGSRSTTSTGNERRLRVVMASSHASRPLFGLQFHPESICTDFGMKLLHNFNQLTIDLAARRDSSVIGRAMLQSPTPLLISSPLTTNTRSTSSAASSLSSSEDNCEHLPQQQQTLRLRWRKSSSYRSRRDDPCFLENVYAALYNRNPGKEDRAHHRQERGVEEGTRSTTSSSSFSPSFWLDTPVQVVNQHSRFSYMGDASGPCAEVVTASGPYATQCRRRRRPRKEDRWRRRRRREDWRQEEDEGSVIAEDAAEEDVDFEVKMYKRSTLSYLNEQLQRRQLSPCGRRDTGQESLPFDFNGGYVGYLGYELKRECGAGEGRHSSRLPDAHLIFADRVLAHDAITGDVFLLCIGGSDEGSEEGIECGRKIHTRDPASGADDVGDEDTAEEGDEEALAQAWFTRTETTLRAVFEEGCTCGEEASADSQLLARSEKSKAPPPVFTLEQSHDDYLRCIETCMRKIQEGETYEVCLTNRLRSSCEVDPFTLYRTLRRRNGAPYAAYIRMGEELAICCSSPERFLRVDQARQVESKPIKGTIRRGRSSMEDEALRDQLASSVKDRAENLMIVDLVRNDLGRTCEVGTVCVPQLMQVESYATVHQLVSTVRGRLREDQTSVECLQEAFPMGSMTGAPKLRTMQIIDQLESSARGVYSGTIGFFALNGAINTNVVIRTAAVFSGHVEIGVGGAIISMSDPEGEYREILLKGHAVMQAVAVATTGTDAYIVCHNRAQEHQRQMPAKNKS